MIKFFCFVLVFSMQSFASVESAQKLLENMTLTYSQVAYMKSDFQKKSTSSLLGTNEKTKGALEYSKNKFRLELSTKPKSLFIKGSEFFWHVSGDDVTTGKVSMAVPSVFESIFSDPKIWSTLKTAYVSVPQKTAEIKVETKGKVPNISEMTLVIDVDKKTLLKLDYVDDVGNTVEIKLKNTRFFATEKKKRFSYKVKKTDKVNRI